MLLLPCHWAEIPWTCYFLGPFISSTLYSDLLDPPFTHYLPKSSQVQRRNMPVLPAHGLWFLFTCQLVSQLPGIICIFLRLASINWSLWTIWPTCWAFFKPILHDKAVSQHCGCLVTQSCQILCEPKDCSMPGFPCPLLSSRVCPNSCPLSRWRHPTVSSSVAPLSSCPQSFPKSGSFPKSWLFTSCGQSIGASASAAVLPMNIQGWFP